MREKLRVLYYYPYLHFDTGSPKAMAQFIDSLDRSVFEPVFCAHGEGPLIDALRTRNVEIVSGDSDDVSYRQPFAAIAAIRRQAARLKRWNIDIFHANCFPWNTDMILAAWMLRIPVILHVHNAMDVSFQNLLRFACRKVLFCSGFEMEHCKHVERIATKAQVFHNVIDLASFGKGRSIRDSLGLKDGEFCIGTVAQVSHRKGIDILVETARILLNERRDLVFLVAGPLGVSEEEFGSRMRRAAEEPALKGRFRFLGSRSDIADFLSSLDLFILASRHEPMGIVVLEAMAAGIPVVASKVGGIPEMLTSPEIGSLVESVTPDGFAAAIREILARPDRGRSMGEQGKLGLPGRFDLASGGRRLKNIYLEVLGSSATNRGPL